MTPKERLLCAIKGEEVDRIPWSPFLAYFWESQSQHIQNIGQLRFLEEIGADPLLRGFYSLFSIKRRKCMVKEVIKDNEKFITYETPVGTLNSRHVFSTAGNTWFMMDHPIKTEEDLKILTYLNEDMVIEPALSQFEEEYRKLGDRGLHLPVIGTDMKTSFQSLLEHWMGTEELTYALMDYPQAVEECLNEMRRNSKATVNISVQSSAEAFIFWEDSSTTNISPAYFEKYIAPEINEWGEIIHDSDKYLVHHACGHLRALLPLMAKTEIDMIESISPPPTGNIELWEAKELIPEHIGLIGGIEPTIILNCNLKELEDYVTNLISKVGNKKYILANSDSCPPGVSKEKFLLVSQIVRRKI